MKIFIILTMIISVAACSPEKKTLAVASVPPQEDDQFKTIDSPLYVQLGTRWELDTTGSYELNASCEIPKLAPLGTVKNCTFKVPEAKLYYSNLKFLIGTTMSKVCPLLHFYPYYYRRSDDVAFKPAGQTSSIDCSGTPTSKPLCYGGAAPTMLNDFPKNFGRYFNTNVVPQQSFPLSSENSTRWYGGSRVNYLTTNDITDNTTVVHGNGDDARTGSWVDYSVVCTDMWNETLYKINFIIKDENWDPAGAGNDDFTDWP